MGERRSSRSRWALSPVVAGVVAVIALAGAITVRSGDPSPPPASAADILTNSPSSGGSSTPTSSTPLATPPLPTEPVQSVSPTPTGEAAQTAQQFAAWAVGESPTAPFAAQVVLFVGGQETTTLDKSAALERDNWKTCPNGDATYSERRCPVSALRTLGFLKSVDRATPVSGVGVPEVVGCNIVTKPSEVAATVIVTLRPPVEVRNCASDFAVMLYLDDDALIAAVDLVISSP